MGGVQPGGAHHSSRTLSRLRTLQGSGKGRNLGDDALAPSACALTDCLLTTGSYLLFLKQVRAAPPVIVVE